jgi:hypothetical protein
VDKLNHSIESDNEDEQNLLSIFLDETLTEILDEWLENLSEYRIYPGLNDPSDSFPTEKIFTMMQRILEKTVRIPQQVDLPVVPAVPAILPDLHDPNLVPPKPQETIKSAIKKRTLKNRERKNLNTTRNRRKFPKEQ